MLFPFPAFGRPIVSKPVPRWEFESSMGWQSSSSTNGSPVYSWALDALLQSENHRRNPKTGKFEGAGPFYVQHNRVRHRGYRIGYSLFNGQTVGVASACGCASAPATLPVLSTLQQDSRSRMATSMAGNAANYATGYSRARPGNAKASVAQFLGELRDLPQVPLRKLFFKKKKGHRFGTAVPIQDVPKRLREGTLSFRDLGSEYLNVVFGWKPFVNDLRKMYILWKTIDKQMAQLYRESGRAVRRKASISSEWSVQQGPAVGNLKTISSGSGSAENVFAPPPNGDLSAYFPYPFANTYGGPPLTGGSTVYTVTRTTSEKRWFSSDWIYWMPKLGSSQWTRASRAMLFGAIPTPETVWELTPWSWLIDWFSNVGDIVSNFSPNAAGYPVLLEGCMMHHYVQKTYYQADSTLNPPPPGNIYKWDSGTFTANSVVTLETKSRLVDGNPFGLNVQLPSLSGGQLAILAALGISRSKVK